MNSQRRQRCAGGETAEEPTLSLVDVPSLDQLAGDPAQAQKLPAQVAADLLTRVIGLQAALFAQLLRERAWQAQRPVGSDDRLLAVRETAQKLGVSEDWLYRHATTLPFTVRNGRHLRFSQVGLQRWIAARQGRS
jgi:predicted DNA-binding transcriptional regulator AlpA